MVYPSGPMLVSEGSRLEIVCRFATASEGKPALNREAGVISAGVVRT